MATLGFERGTAFLAPAARVPARARASCIDVAHKNGATEDADHPPASSPTRYIGVQVMKYNGMRMLTSLVQARACSGPRRASASSSGAPGTATSASSRWTCSAPTRSQIVDGRATATYELDELAPHLHGRAGRRPSTPARARSNATSSASGCSGSRASPSRAAAKERHVNFAFSEEQEQLRDAVRKFLEAKSPSRPRCGGSWRRPRATTRRCGSRWPRSSGSRACTIPEEYGGQGFTFVELGIVLEEMGRVLLCAPYFSTVVLAANAILNAGTDDAARRAAARASRSATRSRRSRSPSRTASGTRPASRWRRQRPGRLRTRSTGTKMFVIDGHTANHDRRRRPHRPARSGEDGISFFTVDGDADGPHPHAALDDGPDPQAGAARLLRRRRPRRSASPGRAGPRCSKTLDQAAVCLSNEMVGGAQMVLEMSVEYAKVRVQFGRPDRLVPGDQAQVRRHAARGRVGASRPRTTRRGPRPRTTRSCRSSRAWPRRTAPTRTSTPPPRTSRSTAASASRGSTTRTCTSSGRRAPRSSSATPTYHRELLAQRIGI